jgi:hypothetical protein
VLISHSTRLLFIHVQKTGGISIRDALRKVCTDLEEVHPRHQTLAAALTAYPELADYVIAGFVRNPWDRLVSWWAMVHGAANRPLGHPHHQFLRWPLWRYVSQFRDFEDFVRDIPSGPYERFRTPQYDYLSTPAREADLIGRSERMEQDVAALLGLIGAPVVPVPHANKSSRPVSYRELYSPETAEIVERVFGTDIERFGYRF